MIALPATCYLQLVLININRGGETCPINEAAKQPFRRKKVANEGHIIVKKGKEERQQNIYGMKQFFNPIDKGAAKPAFCYPRRAQGLREEAVTMKRNLDSGMVSAEQKMSYELKLKKINERVSLIDESFENAKQIIDKDPDRWKNRRETLAEEIKERTPSRDQKQKRRVNPHSILRDEKVGGNGKIALEKLKREYTIISRAFQARGDYEESNHSFLQKDN